MKERRKIFIVIICLLILITLIGVPKLFLNKKENTLPEVKLKEIEKNKTFAIMVPDINGSGYIPYEGNAWPTEADDYYYSHSECVDNKGEKIEDVIEYNQEENTALLDTNKTTYCTLYFDKYNYMKASLNSLACGENCKISGPVYMSPKVKNVEFVDSIDTSRAINQWDISDTSQGTPVGSVIAWIEPIKDDTSHDTLYIGSKLKIRATSLDYAFAAGEYGNSITEVKTNLESVNFNNMLDTNKTTSFAGLFANNDKLTQINGTENWDTSRVENFFTVFLECHSLSDFNFIKNWQVTNNAYTIESMFCGCNNFYDLSLLQNWDVSNVISISNMLARTKIKDVSFLNKWNISNVTMLWALFYGCNEITTINLEKWNTSNVKDFNSIFASCTNLQNINISTWDTSEAENVSYMINSCTSLQTIDMSNATFTQIIDSTNYENMFNGVPSTAKIIVKSNQESWIKNTAQFPGTVNTI